ncbi:MAG: hypothetical protein A2Y25_01830 [Candidatus Melainabacteria bacterium GWF2_37_15]|nr:MAG: hypothetical protein A2Y25_01830 [Candidatus Melainabacteria bacterium GWF2_37_15]
MKLQKEKIKEKLANLRNNQTHTWTAMLVTISGSLTLLQSLEKFMNKILFSIGILLFIILLYIYLNRNEFIEKIIQKIED